MGAYLFGNNPSNLSFSRSESSADRGYDIALESDGPNRYWVVRHLDKIGRTEGIAFVHRFDGYDGAIAPVARITGPPTWEAPGYWVPWELRVLPRTRRVEGADLSSDPAWHRRKPFVPESRLFANPIKLDEARLAAITARLHDEDRRWLKLS